MPLIKKGLPGIKKAAKKLLLGLTLFSVMLGTIPAQADESSTPPTTQTEDGERQSGFQVDVINNISIDDINISIAEYEIDYKGDEVPFTQNQIVVPGQYVSKIVRVTNIARPAWIRIKPTFTFEEGMEGVDEDMFVFANDDWVKRGDYYYCTHWLKTDETEDFIKEVFVPTYWDSTYQDKKFEIIFTADAVQMENFTPDFDSNDPWFGTLIEQCIHTHYDEKVEYEIDTNFSVEFQNGAEGLVRIGSDWFKGWEKMMPGDRVTNEAVIGNRYSEPVEIYFWTENIVEGPDELLENLELTIKNGDTVIYHGTMDKEVPKLSLGTYYYNDTSSFTWEVFVPEWLTNRFALTKTKTKWIFSASLQKKTTAAPTGDDMLIYIAGGCFCLMLIAIIVLVIVKIKKKMDDKKKEKELKLDQSSQNKGDS